jgi:ATP-binding cassette subfamily B (MDR/TAP) protein 1
MKLPIFWYERPKNSIGLLTTRLAVDCKQVKEMTTTYLYVLIENASSLVIGLIVALVFEWRTALVALGLIPIIIAAGFIRMTLRIGSGNKAEEPYRDSLSFIM